MPTHIGIDYQDSYINSYMTYYLKPTWINISEAAICTTIDMFLILFLETIDLCYRYYLRLYYL